MDLKRAILNFAIAFEKDYNKKLVATSVVNTVKDIMGSNFFNGMSTQFYYRYVPTAKIMLRHEIVLPLVESSQADDTESKSLNVCRLDDIGLYTAAMKELQILVKAARNFAKNPKNPAPYHTSTFNTSAKMLLLELRAVLVDHGTESDLTFVVSLNKAMFHKRTARTFLL